ncbi:NHL repeat-containing protein [Massilia sp. SR12]
MTKFHHVTHYGEIAMPGSTVRGELPLDFTMNSPVGIARDHYNHIWVCDTGNSRVLVFTADLNTLLHVIDTPGAGSEQARRLLMPFHLCPHPEQDLMYCTDMGNSRVVVFEYDEHAVDFQFAFGDAADGINGKNFVPLTDPNGITIVREANGQHFVYVSDEFFHTEGNDDSRCVKFTTEGKFVHQFRAVDDANSVHNLLWPQGLASDNHGNIYLANTGHYEILKIDTAWPVKNERVQCPGETSLLHSFGDPTGIGKFNVMRSVCVINDRIFVPGQLEDSITVYDTNGKRLTVVEGMLPLWSSKPQVAHSLADMVYGALQDAIFVGPYQICEAAEPNVYYVTEPFASIVLKMRIAPVRDGSDQAAILLDAVGHRRDNQVIKSATSQFNCMTSVIGVDPARAGTGKLPHLNWIDSWATATANVYKYWYDQVTQHAKLDPLANASTSSFNIDSGNWCMKTFNTAADPIAQLHDMMRGFFMPGGLAMAVYYPSEAQPLLGQICPGTPLVFITNFNAGTVSMFQFGPGGHLLNYGLPFGRDGTGGDGTLHAPQGLEVNSHGEIYIADSGNNRISMWQLQTSGMVSFVKNFQWEEKGVPLAKFAPSDVTIDAQDRVFVCDQFNDCIRVFDRQGKSLWHYGKSGYCDDPDKDFEKFYLPASLCADREGHLIVNDLVNRALKIFRIGEDTLEYVTGDVVFKKHPEAGGVWMPFFIYARDRRVYVPDTTYNVVNIYAYKPE